jgi:co-chaperonin GroES (HSP10)
MQKLDINLNEPLLKSESGLLVSPEVLEKKNINSSVQKYNERYVKNLNAPTPNIKISYSYILTKAVPPKLNETTAAGIIINEKEVDVRMAKKLEIMSENVSDEQEVLLCGEHVMASVCVPGDTVRINYDKYLRLNDDHTAGVIQKGYEIPLYEIDGNEYLILDARDVIYSIPKDINNEVTNK